jgi:hypothetical protein
MLVRGRWRTVTVLISTRLTPHIALSHTVAVNSESHVRTANLLRSIGRLPHRSAVQTAHFGVGRERLASLVNPGWRAGPRPHL